MIFSLFLSLCQVVTLHVSVWVEISIITDLGTHQVVTLHVSVWVEILCRVCKVPSETVTLHVSVWVEMCHYKCNSCRGWSRSTWACELKLRKSIIISLRELSRSTWACELKLSCKDLYRSYNLSRSTWACELKLGRGKHKRKRKGHAPRERVSWNLPNSRGITFTYVTLHVSVWVEMLWRTSLAPISAVTLHVSVWVEIHLL